MEGVGRDKIVVVVFLAVVVGDLIFLFCFLCGEISSVTVSPLSFGGSNLLKYFTCCVVANVTFFFFFIIFFKEVKYFI